MGKVLSQHKENNWQYQERPFFMPYQSELTHSAIHQILNTRKSDFTILDESFTLHKPMLEAFNKHLEEFSGTKYGKCPIT